MAKKPVPTPATKPAKGTSKPSAVPSQADLDKAWAQSRTKPPQKGGGFQVADIPDGDYAVQVQSAKCSDYKSGGKKGTRYFKIKYAIMAGPHTGTVVESSDDLSLREIGDTGRTAMDYLSDRLQRMDIDISETPTASLPALAQAMGDPKSEVGKRYLSVNVRTKVVDGAKGQMTFQSVYINERLDEAAVKQLAKALS